MIRRRALERKPSTPGRLRQSKAAPRSGARRGDAAEIIVKEGYSLASTPQGDTIALPELIILANRKGFSFLAEVFDEMAKRGLGHAGAGDPDPDNHEHLGWARPFNSALGDRVEIRLGIFTVANRSNVLARYGISKTSRSRGDLQNRFRRLIQQSRAAVEQESRPGARHRVTTRAAR